MVKAEEEAAMVDAVDRVGMAVAVKQAVAEARVAEGPEVPAARPKCHHVATGRAMPCLRQRAQPDVVTEQLPEPFANVAPPVHR